MQRNERGVQRYSSFITVTRLRIDASSHGETANGAAASAKSELLTYAYYVRTFKYYPPAIYHGQGLARYGRMGSDYYPMSKSEDCYPYFYPKYRCLFSGDLVGNYFAVDT